MRNPTKGEALIGLVWSIVLVVAGLMPANGSSDYQTAGPLVWLFLGAVALAIIAGFLIPKPKAERFDDRPPQLVTRGEQVAYAIGRRVTSIKPLHVWGRYSREESSGGGKKGGFGGSQPKQTIYYENSVHLLGLGPASKLHRILRGSEEVIFQGPVSPDDTPSGTTLQDLEGNSFRIFWGQRNQPINTDLADEEAFGVSSRWPYYCYIQWIERRLGTSATWEQMSYDWEATCVGQVPLGDSDCEIPATTPPSGEGDTYDPGSEDNGINGAHLLYQVLTAAYPHGGGIPVEEIDFRSLKNLGILLETEALAHNVLVIDETPLQNVVADVLADAGVFIIEEEGKLCFMPIRNEASPLDLSDNVVVEPLPSFDIDQGNLADDRIVFMFPDVKNVFTQSDVVTDDDATATATNRKKSRDVRMTTITHQNHANVVADRRKQLLIADKNEIKFTANRTMRRLVPGHSALLSGVGQLRVTGVERDAKGNSAKITASVDQFSLVGSGWTPDVPPPVDPPSLGGPDTFVAVLEAPRAFAGEKLALAVVRGRSGGDGTPASIYTSTTGTSYTLVGVEASVAALGTLRTDLYHTPQGYVPFRLVVETGPTVEFTSDNAARLIDLSGEDADWRADRQVMLLQDEILAVRSFTALGSDLYQSDDIVREQLFTDRQQHSGSAELPVLVVEPENLSIFSRMTWTVGTTVFVKVVPDGVAIDDVDPIEITLTGKALGALPIANLTPLTYTSGDIDFEWGYRLNLGTGAAAGELPAGVAIPTDPGAEGDYIVRIYDTIGNLKRTTIVTTESWTYTSAMQSTDSTTGSNFDIEITARAGGIGGYPVTRRIRNV